MILTKLTPRINGKVRAQFKEIVDGSSVGTFNFNAGFPPIDAIAVNSVGGTGLNEVAVLGQDQSGQLRIQVRELLTGSNVRVILVSTD